MKSEGQQRQQVGWMWGQSADPSEWPGRVSSKAKSPEWKRGGRDCSLYLVKLK